MMTRMDGGMEKRCGRTRRISGMIPQRQQRLLIRVLWLFVGSVSPAIGGCETDVLVNDPAADEMDVVESKSALDYYGWEYGLTFYDDSAAPLHVAISLCESPYSAYEHDIQCGSHPSYAMVGGGAQVIQDSGLAEAMVARSYPMDDYFWRAASRNHIGSGLHKLRVYVIGILLEGVNTEELRQMIELESHYNWNGTDITAYVSSSTHLLSSGFNGIAGTFAKSSVGHPGGGWSYKADDHGDNLPWLFSGLSMHTLPKRIIERFGALEIGYQQSSEYYVSGGMGFVNDDVTDGWAVVGIGGDTRSTSGLGRLLSGLSFAFGARVPIAMSTDNGDTSPGYTSVAWSEARHVQGSHGVCSTGANLNAAWDSCVADVCAELPWCCNFYWAQQCVDRVATACADRSCSDYTCTKPAYDPDWWEATTERDGSNCYGYATNSVGYIRPGDSHYGTWWVTLDDVRRTMAGDGLIPIGDNESCPDNMYKIALFMQEESGVSGDFHFIRQNPDMNTWSHKFSNRRPSNLDSNNVLIQGDPRNYEYDFLTDGPYDVFGGFFCACSAPGQGQGRIPDVAPRIDGYPTPWDRAMHQR